MYIHTFYTTSPVCYRHHSSKPGHILDNVIMPLGLCNDPATFQRLMNLTLPGMLWSECLVYLYNIIAFDCTFEEHLGHLASISIRIEWLQEVGLKEKLPKYLFHQKKVLHVCLGHVISPEGMPSHHITKQKEEKITNGLYNVTDNAFT